MKKEKNTTRRTNIWLIAAVCAALAAGAACGGCRTTASTEPAVTSPAAVSQDYADTMRVSDEELEKTFSFTLSEGGYLLTAYFGSGTNVVIPASYKGEPVIAIDFLAFSDSTTIESVTIPDSVTHIEGYAFSGCESLRSISLPDSLNSIGAYAFEKCSSLTSVSIPAGVSELSPGAFGNCTALTAYEVSPDNPFFKSVDGVLFSGDGATLLAYPTAREGSYTIPDGVTLIAESAFLFCDGLTSVTIPEGVSVIDSYAFCCSGIRSVSLPESLFFIDTGAFQYCENLTTIDIPAGTVNILPDAFFCAGLTSINVSPDNPVYFSEDGVLFHKETMVLLAYPSAREGGYDIPDGVTGIGDSAFAFCTKLSSVTIPDSVTDIGTLAFSNCTGLDSITLPDSVTGIGEFAFVAPIGMTQTVIAPHDESYYNIEPDSQLIWIVE